MVATISRRTTAVDPVGFAVDILARLAASRRTYMVAVLAACSIFWLAPRLPMIDLPQHVAQIALWHDLLMGQSPWVDLFRINLLTPYLTAYSLALALSFIVSANSAFKILLTAAFVAYVASCRQLRRDFGADERVDWVFIPSFFGLAYEWGFATFLICTPICLQFLRHARLQTIATDWRRDAGICALGVILLFSHGLLFVFAGLIGGLLLLHAATTRTQPLRFLIRHAVPYVLLLLACAAFLVATRQLEAPAPLSTIDWPGPFERLGAMARQLHSSNSTIFLPFSFLIAAALTLLRPRLQGAAAIPLAAILLVYFLVPHEAYGTALLYERFAMFILPFSALTCCKPATGATARRLALCHIVLMIGCCGIVALHAQRARAFAVETADFEVVLDAAEPNKRAASIIEDRRSTATGNRVQHLHHASWYQVEKHGLVEFNFAYFHPQVVRYRTSRIPYTGFGFDPDIPNFDWSLPQARSFDYFFVRRHEGAAAPAELIANPACDLKLVKASGLWSLYERGVCRP